jgi:hypothetical protein
MSELPPKPFNTEGLTLIDIENDPLNWATAPRLRDKWIRRFAPEFGIDTSRYILGKVVGGIDGDDLGAFGSYGFLPGYGDHIQASIQERLRYEIGTPEVPVIISGRLVRVKDTLNGIDFNSEMAYWTGRNYWTKYARDFTRHIRDTNPEVRDAYNYSRSEGEDLEDFIEKNIMAHNIKTPLE